MGENNQEWRVVTCAKERERDMDSDRLGQTGKRHVTVSRDRRAGMKGWGLE